MNQPVSPSGAFRFLSLVFAVACSSCAGAPAPGDEPDSAPPPGAADGGDGAANVTVPILVAESGPPESDDSSSAAQPGDDAAPGVGVSLDGSPEAQATLADEDAPGAVPDAGPSTAPLVCPSGQTVCGTSCADTATDLANCGQCGTACTSSGANQHGVCSSGTCSTACNSGYHACGGTCASDTSLDSCGAACSPCPAPPASAVESCADSGQGLACQWACAGATIDCGGVCVNPKLDSGNCGACGRVCAPGACSGGACQAWIVASPMAATNPEYVLSDGTNVIWADDTTHAVSEMNALGTTAPINIAAVPDGTFQGLALKGQKLAFIAQASGDWMMWLATEGSYMSESTFWVPPSTPTGLALGGAAPYAYTTTLASGVVTLWQCDTSSAGQSSAHPCISLATFNSSGVGRDLIYTDQAIYWTDMGSALVSRYLFSNGSVSNVATGQTGVYGLSVDASQVYWTTNDGGAYAVKATSLQSPATPVVLYASQGYSQMTVSDGTNVYFSDGLGSIDSVPTSGGTATVRYEGPSGSILTALTYASGAIYWTDRGTSMVMGLRVP
jgi:hypothetical protein